MSQTRTPVDLSAFERQAPAPAASRRGRLPLRWLVPGALLLGFAVVLFWSLGDVLRGRVEVTVVRPIAQSAGAAATSAGSVVLQAAGWVEPDPYPIQVTALRDGVVSEILALESQAVAKDEPVARLVDADAKIALAVAEASLARAEAERTRAVAEADTAKESFAQAFAVTETARSARAELGGRTAEAEHRKQAVAQGEAQVQIARGELEVQRFLQGNGAAGPRQVELAEARVKEAEATLAILRANVALAEAQVEQARAKADRAERELGLRLDEKLRVATTEAARALALAAVREAEAKRDEAQLALTRTVVRAPVAGIVLQRLVTPGAPLEQRATLLTLYDPKSLRVRVDVPQGEASKLAPGMRCAIDADVRRGQPYPGEVARIVHFADIQKVTLQVHVRVLEPDAWLRPEMLCQVRFHASGEAQAPGVARTSDVVLVPARLVEAEAVWLIAAGERATRRRITAGNRQGDLVEVVAGLNLSDKLVDAGRDQLAEGTRVRVRESPHAGH